MALELSNAAITACLDALGDEAWIIDGTVARRQNSRICRVRSRTRTIAIKECFLPATLTTDVAASEREYNALTRLAGTSLLRDERALGPTPLALCREHASYAMTWLPGRSVTEVVLATSTGANQATSLGAAAGDWLRRFHSKRPLPPQPSDFETKVEFVIRLADDVSPQEPSIRHAAAVLVKSAKAAAAIRMPASWVHGDMKSDNLLVDGSSVMGLDFQMVDENTVVYDLAPFLNHLSMLQSSFRGMWQGTKLNIAAEEFLQAYSPDAARWQLAISWLRTYLLMQILVSTMNRSTLRGMAVRWTVRKELGRLVDHLQGLYAAGISGQI
jgi:Ser/Thr protein kinase RdoA (MazF antagonist)